MSPSAGGSSTTASFGPASGWRSSSASSPRPVPGNARASGGAGPDRSRPRYQRSHPPRAQRWDYRRARGRAEHATQRPSLAGGPPSLARAARAAAVAGAPGRGRGPVQAGPPVVSRRGVHRNHRSRRPLQGLRMLRSWTMLVRALRTLVWPRRTIAKAVAESGPAWPAPAILGLLWPIALVITLSVIGVRLVHPLVPALATVVRFPPRLSLPGAIAIYVAL